MWPSRPTRSTRNHDVESVPRWIQRTLPAGLGGTTGHVSRERSNRIGMVLAQEAAGTHPLQGEKAYFVSTLLGAGKRYSRLGTTLISSARQPELSGSK